jgi:hypothetical protein
MFFDLLTILRDIPHDTRIENGKEVHSFACRHCALALRLREFKRQVSNY